MIELEGKIDEILMEAGILKLDKIKEVWDIQKRTGMKLEEILIEQKYVTKNEIYAVKAKQMGIDFIDLQNYEFKDLQDDYKIPKSMALMYTMLLVNKEENVLTVAMKDPKDIFALDNLRIATSMDIKPVYADPDEIKKQIEKQYREKKKELTLEKEHPVSVEGQGPESAVENRPDKKSNKTANSNDSNFTILSKDKILDSLLKDGAITKEQKYKVLETYNAGNEDIVDILTGEGIIDKKTLYKILEKQTGIQYIDISEIIIPREVVELVNENLARRHVVLPLEKDGIKLKVAMSDPTNIFSIDDLRLATGLEIIPLLADAKKILAFYDMNKPKEKKAVGGRTTKENKEKIIDYEEEIKKVNEEIAFEIIENVSEETIDVSDIQNAPIVKMVNLILHKAALNKASDIHIEPYEDCVMVRNRIDGQLVEVMKHDRKIHQALIARIKIISSLNIAERRLPQDGRISMKIDSRDFDMRVSVLPTMFGEKVVIRLADKEGFNMGKQELGFFEDDMEKFDKILSHPHGIVLVTGPTGSGKSTTLYTALKELCKPDINILTVEDPVENTVKGINQVQVNSKAGLTFSVALRSFLRQDPDIIMVGEIRDSETAEIAMRAAITGHLVLSTLHTNDAASSITRMIDMGIEPFMISSSIAGVIAQRLIRRLCMQCREEYEPAGNERGILKIGEEEQVKLFRQKGCPVCNNTGYKGRIAIYEIMTVNTEMMELISKNVPSSILKDAAVKSGMKTLRDNCSRLVLEGVASMDELYRVTYADD
jgi:type IV pilus assembly protein PilB